ncbi:hypothetical protein ABFS82_08G096100 [Erythranthe guttata]
MKSSSRRRRLVVLTALALVIVAQMVVGQCNGSRTTINAFKTTPHSSSSSSPRGHFSNLLPKRWVPFSAPSRKHNDLGLQTWRLP